MRNSVSPTLNLVHPRPVPCEEIFGSIADQLHLPRISYEAWISRLEEFASATASNDSTAEHQLFERLPALKLLDFFRAVHHKRRSASNSPKLDGEAFGLPGLALDHALEVSQTLRALPPLSGSDAQKWLTHWGLIDS